MVRRLSLLLLTTSACTGLVQSTTDEDPSTSPGAPTPGPGPLDQGGRPGAPSVPGAPATPGMPGAPGAPPTGAACAGRIPAGPAVLRRLTPDEYTNTARDLLGTAMANPRLPPPAGPIISELEVDKLSLAAADLAGLKAHHTYLPCPIDGAHDPACADRFIDTFARAAFRRPVDAEEKVWLRGVYDKVRSTAGVSPAITFRESIDAVAQVILQSPQHTYLHEVGMTGPGLAAGVRRLTGHERASRLSYLLWGSMPDKPLLQAAEQGRLDTPEGVRGEAARLLGTPRARAMVRKFASAWLELDGTQHHPPLEQFEKNSKRFPFDSPALRSAWRAEAEALYERAFFDMNGSFKALMTSPQAYVDGSLAQLYGVPAPKAGTSAWVDLDRSQRSGLLTRAAFLAVQASADHQSPVLRGVYIYRHVLCQPLPDPPADADNTPPAPSASQLKSVRALTDIKTMATGCDSCHKIINPIGYALENYDAMGRWQTEEKGTVGGKSYVVPVDATATILSSDLAGPVTGPVALAARLGDSAMARSCAVERWYARALSRTPTADDQCLLGELKERLGRTDDLRDLVGAIAASDAALYVKEETR